MVTLTSQTDLRPSQKGLQKLIKLLRMRGRNLELNYQTQCLTMLTSLISPNEITLNSTSTITGFSD